jgi:hypothetical protein
MTAPDLHLQIRTGDIHGPSTVWNADAAVTFGRLPAHEPSGCDVVIDADDTSSRHMGTLVPADGVWWLVNPMHLPDETPKKPIKIQCVTGRWHAEVREGGWLALPPGTAGTIRPFTSGGTELHYRVAAPVPADVANAAQWQQSENVTNHDGVLPRNAGATLVSRRRRHRPAHDAAALEAGLAHTGGSLASRTPPPLDLRVLDLIVTAAHFRWDDPTKPFLTSEQVSKLWSIRPDTVEKRIRDGLRKWSKDASEWLADPIVWRDDAERAFSVLRQLGVLAQYQFDWQDLRIDDPDDTPEPGPNGSVGPRPLQTYWTEDP